MMISFVVLIGLLVYFIWHVSSNNRNFQNPQNKQNFDSRQNFESRQSLSEMTTKELESELENRKVTSSLEAEVAALHQELDSLKNKD